MCSSSKTKEINKLLKIQLMATNSQEANARKLDRICKLFKTSFIGYEIWVNIFSTTVFYEELNNLTASFAR